MVQNAIEAFAILIAELAERDSHEVGGGHDSYEVFTAHNGDVMNRIALKYFAEHRDRLAIVNSCQFSGHDFGNRLVLFHRIFLFKNMYVDSAHCKMCAVCGFVKFPLEMIHFLGDAGSQANGARGCVPNRANSRAEAGGRMACHAQVFAADLVCCILL